MTAIITTTFKIKPEHWDDMLQITSEALPDTRSFKGCEFIYACANNETLTISIYEGWSSFENYEKYLAWRKEGGMIEALGDMLSEPFSFSKHEDIFQGPPDLKQAA